MVRATARVGTTLPAHVTAAGKVLLANQPPSVLDEILTAKLPTVTRRSKASAASVRRELVTVAKAGYAINDGESELGLRAVAVLLPAAITGTVDAAITVAGPSERLAPRVVEKITKALFDNVQRFSDPV